MELRGEGRGGEKERDRVERREKDKGEWESEDTVNHGRKQEWKNVGMTVKMGWKVCKTAWDCPSKPMYISVSAFFFFCFLQFRRNIQSNTDQRPRKPVIVNKKKISEGINVAFPEDHRVKLTKRAYLHSCHIWRLVLISLSYYEVQCGHF